jgi:hypothetical protein
MELMKTTLSESNLYKTNTTCRVCGGTSLEKVISLGNQPAANAFLRKENLAEPEPVFPLEAYFCKSCGFVQLLDIVSPELLFREYVYVSSTSPSFVAHFEKLADEVNARLNLPGNALIVDIGSNDGILLRPWKSRGHRVLGIDPAVAIAKVATESGIETWPEFFSEEIADKIVQVHGNANLVTATSVFPHIDDLDSIVSGVKKVLSPDGVFMVEAYYLADMIRKNLFDTIYHEHLSYFSVATIQKLFARLGMEVFAVEETDTHGGSLRVFVQRANGPRKIEKDIIDSFILNEEKQGINKINTYFDFAKTIEENKMHLRKLLLDLKNDGKKIVGYGAPAKGNTLLNYFEIGSDLLDYVVDDSPWKQGLLTPGKHIPVVSIEKIAETKPDYILILAWNFAEPIMKKLDFAKSYGAKFIIPVPKPQIVD